MNYGELVQAIQDYTENSEATFVSNIPNFIRAAEEIIFMSMRAPMHWKTDSAISLGTGTNEFTLPNGTIDVVDIYVVGPDANTDGQYLARKEHSWLNEFMPLRTGVTNTGMPRYYSTDVAAVDTGEPNLKIRVMPRPDVTYTAHIAYYGKSTTDSITNGGNSKTTWLSVSYPNVLLWGSLVQAATFMKEEADLIQGYQSLFNESITLLKNLGESRQQGDEYSDMGKADSAL